MPTYCLGYNYASTAGLNLQYPYIQKVLGRLLEPEILIGQPDQIIADIPCGSCMWLIDLAMSGEIHPSTKLEGFDIKLGQGPPEAWLPSNIKLGQLDLLEDPPVHLVNRFDVIHVSLVVCFVDDSNIDRVVRNIFSMLKPGGYVQWLDSCISEFEFASPDPSYTSQYITRAIARVWEIAGWTCPSWVRGLDTCLTTAGFQDVKTRYIETPRYLGRIFAENELLGFAPIAQTMLSEDSGNAKEVEEFRALCEDAAREVIEKQVGVFPKGLMATARKPRT